MSWKSGVLGAAGAFTIVCAAVVPAAAEPAAVEHTVENTVEIETAEAQVFTGRYRKARPLISTRVGWFRLEVPLLLQARHEAFDAFRVDQDGNEIDSSAATDVQVRVGLSLKTEKNMRPLILEAVYEQDAYLNLDGGESDIDGVGKPYDRRRGLEAAGDDFTGSIRKAYGRASFGSIVTLGGGLMTSHWGLGLLANDGAHGWTPGSARFSDPRGGDKVLRGFVATGPWTRGKVLARLAIDKVRSDDVLLDGDEASQVIGALTVGHEKDTEIGIYVALREQEAADGDVTSVTAIDLYARSEGTNWKLEVEAAYITGDTDLGPNADFEKHDVEQLGVAGRFGYQMGNGGFQFDMLLATGDQNFDDLEQNAFKPDPNFDMGFILFRQVMSGISSRSPITAADPDLIGLPSEDLERLPTRQSPTNTLSFFPRAWWRLAAGFEIYGGPLVAFSNVNTADARPSRLAGGEPRNAFNGTPGAYLGTELDLGLRYRAIMHGSVLLIGLEGGVFQPGNAFDDVDGAAMSAVSGGRLMLSYAL